MKTATARKFSSAENSVVVPAATGTKNPFVDADAVFVGCDEGGIGDVNVESGVKGGAVTGPGGLGVVIAFGVGLGGVELGVTPPGANGANGSGA